MAKCFWVFKELPKIVATKMTRKTGTFVLVVFGLLLLAFGPAHSGELLPEMVKVPAGHFIMGSDRDEREYAYRLDEKVYGHSRTKEWEWSES